MNPFLRLSAKAILLAFVSHSLLHAASTSTWTGSISNNFNTGGNWTGGVPTDVAEFNTASPTSLVLAGGAAVNELYFDPGAASYAIALQTLPMDIGGLGIVNRSGRTQTLTNASVLRFDSGASAGDVTLNNNSSLLFKNTSSAENATITNNNGGSISFQNTATAKNSRITNNDGGYIEFDNTASAGSAVFNTFGNSTILFTNNTDASSATITNHVGAVEFDQNATAGAATIIGNSVGTLGTTIVFSGNSTAGNATFILNGAGMNFHATSSGGNARIIVNSDSFVDFSQVTGGAISAGSIAGAGQFSLGPVALTVGSNGDNTTISGVIYGTGGSLIKVGTGTLTLSGFNTYTGDTTVSGGVVNVLNSLSGNGIVSAGGTLSGTGTLGTLTNNGTVLPGVGGAGTLHAAQYSGSGTLAVTLSPASSTELRVSGNADLTGGTLSVSSPQVVLGRYEVLSAGSLTGTFAAVNGPALPSYLTMSTEYMSTEVLVFIHTLNRFLIAGGTRNQVSAAAALDAAQSMASGTFATDLTTIAQLAQAGQRTALDQINGDSLVSFQTLGFGVSNLFSRQMRDRASNDQKTTYGLWAKGIGNSENIKADSGIGSPAAHSTTGGFQAGYDFPATDDIVFGFSGGYGQSSLDVDERFSTGHASTIQSGIYAGYNPSPWFFNGSLAYLASTNNMNRQIQFSGITEQADSNFAGRIYTAFIEAGYDLKPRDGFVLQPSLSLHERHLEQSGFTESGAPGLNLSVHDESANSLVSALGIRVKRQFLASSSHPLIAAARVSWDHELGSIDNGLTAEFAGGPGATFSVQGTPRNRNAAAIGLDGSVVLSKNLQGFANYSATLGSSQNTQAIFGGLRVTW